MRFLHLLLYLVPAWGLAQLEVEWQREFSITESGVSGLCLIEDKIYLAETNGGRSAFYIFSPQGALTHSTLVGNTRIRSLFIHKGDLCSMGDQHLTRRNIPGDVVSEHLLPWKDGEYISSLNGCILNDRAYAFAFNDLLKYSVQGEQLFRKRVANSCSGQQLDVGGNHIYLYGMLMDPALGGRLMQYDTLGNQKWSVTPVIQVSKLLADNVGNTYLLGGVGGKSYVQRFDKDGNQIWSSHTEGVSYLGGMVLGDSLIVCGGVTTEKPFDQITDNDRRSAWAIYSVKTGKKIFSQTFDIYPGEGYPERFHRVLFDVKTNNVYLGGSYGQQGPVCILVKLGGGGGTSSLTDDKLSRSFSIFPNPGGSRFTISCDEPGTGTIKVTVRNGLGQLIQKKEIPCEGQKSWELDLGKQPAGNYSVEIISGKEKVVKKVIVE